MKKKKHGDSLKMKPFYQDGGETLEYIINSMPQQRKRFYWNDPKVDSLLNANRNLNFVDRYQYPRKHPVLAQNADGTERTAMDYDERKGYSTHSMSSADNLVFPTVVQFRDGSMKRLEPRDAYNYALETGEYIKFPTEAEARHFAENGYKRGMQYWQDGGAVRENEFLRKGLVSTQGYKADSPDRFNTFNIIPSNQITMKGVQFPVMGVDNLGNRQLMLPGAEYTFPGQSVLEVPLYGQQMYKEDRPGARRKLQKGGSVVGKPEAISWSIGYQKLQGNGWSEPETVATLADGGRS
jgi:hypothetical protein